MKKWILYTYVFCLATLAAAQDYLAPSPDAMGLMRQASAQVSHYTGSLGIGIPLAELSGRELGITASLSYNTTGNRVQDIAGSEGLGWTLSAGGMISRVVRGVPDDLTNGYCTAGRTDKEPDLFVFSFMGRSGRFVLDANGNPVLYPYQDLLIKPGICRTTAQTWEIVDENGVRYLFGASSASRETISSKPVTGTTTTSYVSTWYLSSVISPNGTDQITFSYTSSSISYVSYFFTKEDGCVANTSLKNESSQVTVSTRYPVTITTSGGYMHFSWNGNREDIAGGLSLAGVRVTDRQGNQTRKLRFEYGYFLSTGCSSDLCKRLRLERIYDLSPDPLHAFEYNTTVNLPARDSKNFDHWGYYNNNTVNSWIPADSYLGYTGASRAPDEARMQANLLTRINQRGGGYQQFTYEGNWGIKNAQTYLVSGSRIKSSQTGDGRGNVYTKNYTYTKDGTTETSGQLFRLPLYSVYYGNSTTVYVTRRYSHAYSELLDLNGTAVGYSRVEESSPGSGKIVYTFTNYDTNPDLTSSGDVGADSPPFASVSSLFWERGNPKTITVYNGSTQRQSEDSFEYTFNHPNKRQITASRSIRVDYQGCNLGTGYASITSSYFITSRPFTLKKKTSKVFDQLNAALLSTSVTDYSYDATTYQLTSTTQYHAALPTEKYITTLKYVTHPDYDFDQNAYCQTRLNQCLQMCLGDAACESNCYTAQTTCLNSAQGGEINATFKLMRSRHMHNVLIEEQQWTERNAVKRLIAARLNQYKRQPNNQNLVQRSSILVSEKVSGSFVGSYMDDNGYLSVPASYKTVQTYNSHDAVTGKLLERTDADGIASQYAWSYDQTLIQSETVKGGTETRTTSYDYKPLVGVTKKTDANGRSVSQEYDAMGRLRMTKDHDGDILERYRYHYANETPGFLVTASQPQANVGQTITFSVNDLFVSTAGTTHLRWAMGDGRVFDDNRSSATVSYATAGTFVVSVTLTTNEYAPVTRSVQVIIRRPLDFTICVDGPVQVDVCRQKLPVYGACTSLNNSEYANVDLQADAVSGTGCSNGYSYSWEYRINTNTLPNPLGTGQKVTFIYPGESADYRIRCTMTDACGTTVVQEQLISYYRSNNCVGTGVLSIKELAAASPAIGNAPDTDQAMPGAATEAKPLRRPAGTPAGGFYEQKAQGKE